MRENGREASQLARDYRPDNPCIVSVERCSDSVSSKSGTDRYSYRKDAMQLNVLSSLIRLQSPPSLATVTLGLMVTTSAIMFEELPRDFRMINRERQDIGDACRGWPIDSAINCHSESLNLSVPSGHVTACCLSRYTCPFHQKGSSPR